MAELTQQHMLTTVDNPFDPTKEFVEWDAYDRRAGYHTMAYLARVVVTSHELSEADQELALETAVREIAELNVLGIYRLVPIPVTESSEVASTD